MKSRLVIGISALTAAAALALPLRLAAQNKNNHQHHHYQFIDMGTFGGPASSINFPMWLGTLNRQGVAVGWSASATPTSPTSNPLICGGLDGIVPFITHTFSWRDGSVSDLGSLAGPNFCSEPFWVSDRGQIVGASENGLIDQQFFGLNQIHAVIWTSGRITDLGTLGGNQVMAFGINNRGQAVGNSTTAIPDPYCYFGTNQMHAFLWQQGQMQDLGTFGGNCSFVGGSDDAVQGINERGQVVGSSTTSPIPDPQTGVPPLDPFLWEQGKGMTDLGTLGGTFGAAQGINNPGQIIGQSSIVSDPGACNGFPDNGDLNCHAFLWDKGTIRDLTTSTTGGSPSIVKKINDAGEIVGSGAFPGAPIEAYLWREGAATDLGNLGDCYSSAQAINSGSQVVGFTYSCDGMVSRAFLWERGSIVDLNTLIPPGADLQLAAAGNINDRGEIVGDGLLANGDLHGFLLIPCDDAHPSVEGCDYSMVDAPAAPQMTPALHSPSTTLHPSLMHPRSRYRFPGFAIGSRN